MMTLSRSVLLLLVVGVAACGDSSTAPTAPTAPTTPTTPTTPTADTLMPTLSSIQNLVFTPKCISHHGPSEAEAGLDLSAGLSFSNLVNVASTQVALNMVTPNDAENSYLIHKLDGRADIVGVRMPVADSFLSAAEIDIIKQWINAGAQNN